MSEQQMIDSIDQSVQQCQQKAEMMMNKYKAVGVEAEQILQEQAAPETPAEQTSKAVEKPEGDFWRKYKFNPQASSKTKRLERQANYAKVKHFCECLEAFLMDGYSGEIPQQAIK